MLSMKRTRSLLLHPAVLVPIAFVAGVFMHVAASAGGAPMSQLDVGSHGMVMVVRASREPTAQVERRLNRASIAVSSSERRSRLTPPKASANVIPMTTR